MKKVTKEWFWLMSATVASLLCVVILISAGVQPQLSLPGGIYFILAPVALVYFVRLLLWVTGRIAKRLKRG